jgi:hypothetical protein
MLTGSLRHPLRHRPPFHVLVRPPASIHPRSSHQNNRRGVLFHIKIISDYTLTEPLSIPLSDLFNIVIFKTKHRLTPLRPPSSNSSSVLPKGLLVHRSPSCPLTYPRAFNEYIDDIMVSIFQRFVRPFPKKLLQKNEEVPLRPPSILPSADLAYGIERNSLTPYIVHFLYRLTIPSFYTDKRRLLLLRLTGFFSKLT